MAGTFALLCIFSPAFYFVSFFVQSASFFLAHALAASYLGIWHPPIPSLVLVSSLIFVLLYMERLVESRAKQST